MNKSTRDRLLTFVREDRVVALEQALVRIPSETLEETELALYLSKYMEAIGLEVELQAVPIGEKLAGIQPVGRLRGAGGGPSLLLCGHMDFLGLYEPESWLHEPFGGELEDGYIYGRGAKDEKGGICAAISAAEGLSNSGTRLCGDLVIAPVLGHKTKSVGGGIGARHLMARGPIADLAIVTENSNLGIATRCVGRVTARLHMRAAADSSFDHGSVDLYSTLAELIQRLGKNFGSLKKGDWLKFEPNPSFPGFPMLLYEGVEVAVGSLSGRSCTLTINIRTVPGQTVHSVKADLESVIASLGCDEHSCRCWVEILEPVRNPHEIAETDQLVLAVASAHGYVRGSPPQVGLAPRRGAVSDASFLIEGGLFRTIVYGPGSTEADFTDIPDERIAVQDLVDCARVYALTAAILCGIA